MVLEGCGVVRLSGFDGGLEVSNKYGLPVNLDARFDMFHIRIVPNLTVMETTPPGNKNSRKGEIK
jgi:hypothetical protein